MIRGCGYWWAITEARAHALMACPDGNPEFHRPLELSQKWPLPSPLRGRARAGGRQLDCFHNKGAVDQSFECQQAGFAQPLLVRAGSDEIEPGADRDQGVCGAGARRPLADRHLTRRVGKLLHRPPIGGDERRGGGSEDGPEFYILFAGVKRTGPDGLLVLQNVLWHAQEWTENPRSFPQVLLL